MEGFYAVTIGRQYGSGGHEIARQMAQRLGIEYYDKELITQAARESGMSEQLFEHMDEQATSSLFYSLVMGTYSSPKGILGMSTRPLTDQLYQFQAKVMKEAVEKGNCLFVGRCADYILRDHPRLRRIFVYADMESRKKRLVEVYGHPEEGLERTLRQADKKRANYYDYYTERRWGEAKNYDLCVNIAILGMEGTTEFLVDWVKRTL